MLFRAVRSRCACAAALGVCGWLSSAAEPLLAQDPPPAAVTATPMGDAAPSQPPEGDRYSRLTLPELEEIARRNNPTLHQAAWLIERARGNWTQVGLYPNPVVGYQASEIGGGGTAGQQGAFVSQEFVTADKLELNRAVVSQDISRLSWQYEAQQLRVLNDLRSRFYEVLGAQKRVLIAMRLLEVAEQGVRVAKQLFQAKSGSRPDVLQAEIQRNEVRIALQTARQQHEAAWKRLLNVAGRPDLAPTLLEGELERDRPDLEWEPVWQRLLAGNPQLQAAQYRVSRWRYQIERASVEPIPNLQLQAGTQYDYDADIAIAGLQLGIPLPIYDRNQGNIYAAGSELHRAQHEVRRLELVLRDRLALAFQRYETAQFQVERYQKDILPTAQENLNLSTEGYQLGEFDFLRVLTARRSYFEANLAYINALTELRQTEVRIEGLLLTGGLDEVGE